MRIRDYRLANCDLYRIPEIDMSGIEGQLALSIANAWKGGHSATSTIDSLLTDQAVLNPLVSQIQENLEYQKSAFTATMLAEKQRLLAEYDKQRQAALSEIDMRHGEEKAQNTQLYENAKQKLQQQYNSYESTRRRLSELREKVRGIVGKLGGTENYASLMEIHNEVVGRPEAKADYSTVVIQAKKAEKELKEQSKGTFFHGLMKRVLTLLGRGE